MQPNEVSPYPWHTVTTDYVTGFPMTADNHKAIAVFAAAAVVVLYSVVKVADCTSDYIVADACLVVSAKSAATLAL